MRGSIALSIAVACSLAGPASAADRRVEQPIQQLERGFNSGNITLARSAHVAAPEITDEFAPFHWTGKGSFDRWLSDLAKADKAEGTSGGTVALGNPLVETVDHGRAYVVRPSTYTFKRGGKTMRETGTMTFVLVNTRAGWKIASWTWSSPEGVPIG